MKPRSFPPARFAFPLFSFVLFAGWGKAVRSFLQKLGGKGEDCIHLSLSLSLYLSGYDSMLYRWPVFFFPPLFVDWRLVGLDGDVRRLN